ncbi:hypothetical protein [Mucilaginibacter antarcticus]|uniref:hypothetical protein n=1 Tax=Mucilaginibacter antarcticus TaxID=1855725 RepID=UPI0036458D7A
MMSLFLTAKSQNWQPGAFYDVKGTKSTGLISLYPGGKGPIKDEAFIGYKEDAKAQPMTLSASDLRSFVAGRDSFIVAAPQGWSKYRLDFVHVAVDAPIRLFAVIGGSNSGGGGGFKPGISIGAGAGTGGGFNGGGGFGGGMSGGISIPIGRNSGGSGGGGHSGRALYFYGVNTAEMKPVTDENFVDVMTEIMGDEPDVVEKSKPKNSVQRQLAN